MSAAMYEQWRTALYSIWSHQFDGSVPQQGDPEDFSELGFVLSDCVLMLLLRVFPFRVPVLIQSFFYSLRSTRSMSLAMYEQLLSAPHSIVYIGDVDGQDLLHYVYDRSETRRRNINRLD